MCLILTGCYDMPPPPKPNPKAEELRHELFVECMKLAADMKRQGDDDVSDAIEECGSQSYWMSNHERQK
jgi:hypothetical protein